MKDGERYIQAAISSTLRAMPRDAELVVLDDGSTDRTPAILDRWRNRIVVHRNSAPRGLAQGLNQLIEATDSEFIARMDADDVCLPWRFRRQLKYAESADLIFTAIVFTNSRGLPTRPDLVGTIGPAAAGLHLLLASCFSHPTMLARRAALPEDGYRPLAAEDYDMWLRVLSSGGRLARDPIPGLLYRRHSGQVSGSDVWSEQRIQELGDGRIMQSYRDALRAQGMDSGAPQSALRFAMAMTPPDTASGRAWISALHRSVEDQLPRLSGRERSALKTRLARLRARLNDSTP